MSWPYIPLILRTHHAKSILCCCGIIKLSKWFWKIQLETAIPTIPDAVHCRCALPRCIAHRNTKHNMKRNTKRNTKRQAQYQMIAIAGGDLCLRQSSSVSATTLCHREEEPLGRRSQRQLFCQCLSITTVLLDTILGTCPSPQWSAWSQRQTLQLCT